MKYQQLENLESGWKLQYLIRKHREGENITRYIDSSEIEQQVITLMNSKQSPKIVNEWIDDNLNPELDNRLKQAIRAKRKRYFNAEQQVSRKKSIDLDYIVWQKLASMAKYKNMTLSETVNYLVEQIEKTHQYLSKLGLLRENLAEILSQSDKSR